MTEIDLETMDLEDLKQLRKNVERAIQNYDKRRRRQALAAAEASVKDLGFSLSDLLGHEVKGKGSKKSSPPKYRHPQDPKITWTGKSRQPEWFKEAINAGTPAEDLLLRQEK